MISTAQSVFPDQHGPDSLSISKEVTIEKKSIKRYPDPVIMTGKDLQPLVGKEIDHLRVLVLVDNILVVIPFQIDEMNEKGDFVFTSGPKANREEGTGLLKEQDELVFMAKDLGDRLGDGGWPFPGQDTMEIEVTDPLNGAQGWAYLVYFFNEPPPRSPTTYCRWNDEEIVVQCRSYDLSHNLKGEHMGGYTNITIHPEGKGNDMNLVDRFKARMEFKLLFSLITIHINEERVLSKTTCWIDGPVRVVRREANFIKIGYGIRTPSVDHDSIYYFNTIVTSLDLHFPFRPSLFFSDAQIFMGTDYSREAFGMRFYNSNNLEGFLVDGIMSPLEMEVNHSKDLWRVITGPAGTFLTRQVAPSKETELFFQQVYTGVGYVDDCSTSHSPESVQGQIGHTFQIYDLMALKKGGFYSSNLEWNFPEGYEPGEEVQYLNKSDHPVTYTTSRRDQNYRSCL